MTKQHFIAERDVRAGLRDLELLWHSYLNRKPDDPSWRHPKGMDYPYERSPRLIASEEGSLGVIPRLILIRDFVQSTQEAFFKKASELAKEFRKAKDRKLSITNRVKLLRLGGRAYEPTDKTDLYKDGILIWVNEVRQRDELDEIDTIASLFDRPFSGTEAIFQYHEMLCGHFRPRQPFSEPRTFVLEGNDTDRDNLVAALCREIEIPGSGEPQSQLINIHATQLWAGLAACASWIAKTFERDSRRVLIIPVRRPRPAKARDDNQSDIARTEDHRTDVLNLAEILGILRAFVDGGLDKVASYKPFRNEDGLFEVFHHIRVGLANRPAILIFDGHFEPATRFAHLERHVNDDYLESLILRLLDPPICSAEDDFDLARFATNRIIVTSNKKMTALTKIPLPPGVKEAVFFPLTPPKSIEAFERVIDLQPLQYPKPVKALLLRSERFRDRHLDLAHLLDAFVGAVAATKGHPTTLPAMEGYLPTQSDEDDERFCLDVMWHFMKYLDDRQPIWRDILMLVALTPDGLRPDSLMRFAQRASKLPEFAPNSKGRRTTIRARLRPCEELVKSALKGTLETEIKRLSHATYSIFGLVRSDVFEGVDNLEHPLELGVEESHATLGPTARSLDILFPELKAVAKKFAAERLELLQFHALHRLICEEALQQQTVSLRHFDETGLQTIRPWRRMLSAFFHGLQSLPLEDRRGAAPAIGDIDLGGRDLVSHRKPAEFWRYLYAFCYRRMLERPPAWNLTRLYGLDELKADLLGGFDKPWMLLPGPIAKPRSTGVPGLFSAKENQELASDWTLSLAQAQIAIGDLRTAEATLGANSVINPLSRLKRQIDIKILQCASVDERAITDELCEHTKLTQDDVAAITAHLEKVTEAFVTSISGRDAETSERDIAAAAKTVDLLFTHDQKGLLCSDIADIYFRLAEVQATRADLASAVVQYRDCLGPDQLSAMLNPAMLKDVALDSPSAIDRAFCRSLAHYRFAEQLRLRAFSNDMTGNDFFASGHQIRQSIRVALKLELKARNARRGTDERATDQVGLFGRFARRNCDTLTRHLFRYPRERASQIILEATMLRHLAIGSNDKRLAQLRLARRYLGAAERLVVGLGRKARVRLRLALERAKVNRDIARILKKQKDDRIAELYFMQSRCDIDYLIASAKQQRLPFWTILGSIQENKLDIARRGD